MPRCSFVVQAYDYFLFRPLTIFNLSNRKTIISKTQHICNVLVKLYQFLFKEVDDLFFNLEFNNRGYCIDRRAYVFLHVYAVTLLGAFALQV